MNAQFLPKINHLKLKQGFSVQRLNSKDVDLAFQNLWNDFPKLLSAWKIVKNDAKYLETQKICDFFGFLYKNTALLHALLMIYDFTNDLDVSTFNR